MKFPLMDMDLLEQLPKASKRGDIQRMVESPNSEDYVTWNIFALLKRIPEGKWWPALVELARRDNQDIPNGLANEAVSEPELWHLVSSPAGYESASRLRMAESENPIWTARAQNSRAVEGKSEIDIVVRTGSSLVFCEAKLHSDVNDSTTYDPLRNQIVRNIDCLLDSAGEKTALFWMLVNDRNPSRSYMELLTTYRSDPAALAALLPHQEGKVENVASRIAVLLWSDVLLMLRGFLETDSAEIKEVLQELERRTGAAA